MGSAEINGPLWSTAPADWATLQEPNHAPLFEEMLGAADVGEGTRLLDVGCGAGVSTQLAVARGAKVCGIDAAEGLIDYARAAVPSAEFRVGDMQHLPFDDDAFDVVFAANSIQYAEDLGATLTEFRRVTKSGGRVIAGLFAPADQTAYASIFAAVKEVMPPPPPGAKSGGPFALSVPGVLEGHFEDAGLSASQARRVEAPFSYASVDDHWRVCKSAGPFQSMFRAVSEATLERAVGTACKPFTREDGSVTIPNAFIYVVATLP